MTATILWGDGTSSTITPTQSSGQFQFNTSHTFPDNGTYNVQISLSDGTDTITSTTSALITNVAPSYTTTNLTATVGQSLNVAAISISDPGFNSVIGTVETFTATIDWGDGTGVQPIAITDYVAGKVGTPTTAELPLVHYVRFRWPIHGARDGQRR